MDGCFERNLTILGKRQPKLAARIRDIARNRDVSSDSLPGEKQIFLNGSDGSGFPSERSLSEPVAYVIGIGPDTIFRDFFLRLPAHVRFVVIVEVHVDRFVSFLEKTPVYDPSTGRNIVFCVSDESTFLDEAVKAAFGEKGFVVGRCATTVSLYDRNAGNAGEYASLASAFERALGFQIENLGNSAEDSLLGLRQMALSSPWTLFGHKLSALEGRFRDWPAVIVSAGPSLDKNLHLLKGRENDLVIIAVDTVLGKLLKNGIVPHFVTALERGAVVYEYHFRKILDENPPELKNIILAVQSVCVPRIPGRWPGPVIVLGKRDIVLDREVVDGLLGGRVIPSGSSVAHMGLGLAQKLGCSSVALIGQDLAFADDGRSHAGETYWEKNSADMRTPREDRLVVPAVNGGTVETTKIWRFFIDQFTRMAAEMTVPLHDCTEGGALIPGTIVTEFQRFLEESIPVGQPDGVQASLQSALSDPAARGADLAAFDRRYLALQLSFRRAQEIIDRALGLLRSLEAPVLTAPKRDAIVNAVRKKLNDLSGLSPILTYVGQAKFAVLIADTYRLRDLADRPILMKWVRSHREFLDNQAISVRMITGWLLYIDGIRQMAETIAPLLTARNASALLAEYLHRGTEETFRDAIMIDVLLSRVEPAIQEYPNIVLFGAARHYMREKRFEEAERLLECLASQSGEERKDIDLLLRWATCLIGSDLCWKPDYEKARRVLADVYRMEPKRSELEPFCENLLREWIKSAERTILLLKGTTAPRGTMRWIALNEQLKRMLKKFSQNAEEAKEMFLAPLLWPPKQEGAEADHAANMRNNPVR